ncbi:hypothetical protein KRP22_013261 [Phytophthora ramorum]|nr:ABC transporter G family member 34 [Phytophthora ramorum]
MTATHPDEPMRATIEYDNGKTLMARGPQALHNHVASRMEKALGRALPQMEVRFKDVSISADITVKDETDVQTELPTLTNELMKSFRGLGAKKHTVKKQILKNVSGVFKPGTITLVLGQPGSGKSSLMKLLSGRFPDSKNLTKEGEVTYNGAPANELLRRLPQFVSYVTQRDKHYPSLSVKETLEFAHACCGGGFSERDAQHFAGGTPEENKAALDAATAMFKHYPDIVIQQLGLDNCQNTIVGDAMTRGVSGGERKRVTTGEMEFGNKEKHFVPVTVAFKDLWYTVPDPSNPKDTIDLLKGISGYALPGTITALMGSSGAGKTTLMDVIAGRKTGGKITGQILLNGHPATDLAIRRSTGYCEQMDIHSESATIREALTFSAFLRQGVDVPDSNKYDSVNECLDLLDLHPIADQIIRGSSVEQMKRLTIGVELAAQPSVLFLDEPTSGLDARSAKLIMDGVRKVADTGRTVVCTIHQPSTEVFSVFDSLLLLKRGGETVFAGELGKNASEMIAYFEGIDGVTKLEDNYNPATWMLEDLWYTVPDPSNPKDTIDLLKGISGYALPGTITALMGSSGAGKTTLMDVIAGRKTGGKITGQILLNGHPATDLAIRRSTGYCEQMDIHSESATIREALTFSAFLRQGVDVPDSNKYDSVNECLDLLDLHPIADQIIRGSSVEQMKRLTIGVELAAQPSVLFLDEPTSGLDARSAKLIMDGVRKVADTGRTVVCTIHQPSTEVFSVFDSLLLLKRGGETVFAGELGKNASEMIAYFEGIDGVTKLEDNYNPATWMLEVIGAGVGNSNGDKTDFVEVFQASKHFELLQSGLDREGLGCFQKMGASPTAPEALRLPGSGRDPDTSALDVLQVLILNQPAHMAQNSVLTLQSISEGSRQIRTMRDPVVESPNRPQHRLLISPLKSLHSDQSVDARLNALESCLSWVYIRLLLLMGASWAIQAAELVLLIFTRVIVADDIGMGEQALEIFGASILMGSVAGGPIFGHVADAFGRRKALLLAMVLSVGGLAVSAQAEAEYVLIIGRVVTGLGFGGQFSSTLVLLQELVPRSMRGRVVSLLDAFTGLGGMVGVGLAFAVEPWLKWRTTYMLVCSFVLYTVVLHFTIPESPRWLASVGRMEEAYAAVEKIERLHHLQPPSDDIPKIVLGFKSVFAPLPSSTIRPSSCKQMTPILSLLTLWIAITLSSYTLGIYVPTLIGLEGFNMFKSWSTVALNEVSDDYSLVRTPRSSPSGGETLLSVAPATEKHFVPVTVAFKDLWYTVPDPSNPKDTIDLLKGISGYALPGTITALMGSSGAGKTTLMDVIAGRKTGGKIAGQILLNGHPATDLAIRRSTGYCEQMDIHSESATIREALTFSAFLRQGVDVPDSNKYDSVNECLDLLDLHPIADQIIRGSSVEQMKRLTIGVELAAQPSVLFLDEPTSGLDARSAKLIMDGVRKVADTGRTVVCTIHQPSTEVFSVFDSLLLLKRGGETVFAGELGKNASEMIAYFEGIDGVTKLEDNYNPATWMLEVIGAALSWLLNETEAII